MSADRRSPLLGLRHELRTCRSYRLPEHAVCATCYAPNTRGEGNGIPGTRLALCLRAMAMRDRANRAEVTLDELRRFDRERFFAGLRAGLR